MAKITTQIPNTSNLGIPEETPDATTILKGKIKLAGDLGGTADNPTTPTAIHITGNETKDGVLTLNDGLIIAGGQPIVTSTPNLTTTESNGVQGKINPVNLPLSTAVINAINVQDATVLHKTGEVFSEAVGFPPMLVQNESSSAIEKRYLSPEATRLSNAYTLLVCWGDSLTQGAGSTGGLSYPTRLANSTTYTVLNKGVGGETSTQIKDRMIADTGNYDKTVIIWAGRNNAGDTTTVNNDIATMVDALGHERYLIMGILNGDYSSEWDTGITYPKIIGLNNSLSSIYGKRYVPIREILISNQDGSAQDLIDVSRDIVPASLRSDNIHLNDKGYKIVEEVIYQRLGIALGQEGYLQSKDFKGLFESYNPLHTYGNETATGLKTFTNTANTADTGFIFNNSGTGLNANNIRGFITSGGNLINADISAGGSIVYGNITGSSGFGLRLVNGGTGLRIDNYTTSSRAILLNIFNNSRGIDIQNGGTFASYYSNTTAGGTGFQAITPTGTAYLATVTGSAVGASFTSQSSSSLMRLDGQAGVTGNLLELRSLGTNVSWFSSLGVLNTPAFKFTSTPPTSAGGHDILTVNNSTLLVEKVPSNTFAPKVLTGFTPATGTITGTDTVLQGIQKNAGNLALKADLASPTLTGTPTAPTATAGTNTTQIANTIFVNTKKNESGQVKVNYIGLFTTNFIAETIKTLDINAATPTIVSSPTTTYPKSTPNNYGGFFASGRGSSPTGRLIENPINGQVHTWRVQITYTNKASGSNGALDVILSNPVSGFQYVMPFTLPSGRTSGTLNLNAITIADGASIPSPNGYILQAVTSFTDANLTLEILSITRISQAVEII